MWKSSATFTSFDTQVVVSGFCVVLYKYPYLCVYVWVDVCFICVYMYMLYVGYTFLSYQPFIRVVRWTSFFYESIGGTSIFVFPHLCFAFLSFFCLFLSFLLFFLRFSKVPSTFACWWGQLFNRAINTWRRENVNIF